MDVSATPATGQTPAASAKQQGQGSTAVSSDFQTFLRMLTTQIQNQDPLNPMESTEFAQQLATFSGVEQQVKTNTLLSALSAQMGLSGMAQMAGWVGMEARTAAPARFEGVPLTLYPTPSADADAAVLVAFDSGGREVTRTQVPVSDDPLIWAGTDSGNAPLPEGLYSFRLESYVEGKLAGTTAVESYGKVTEVRNGADGTRIVLNGGGTVTPDEVRALKQPASP